MRRFWTCVALAVFAAACLPTESTPVVSNVIEVINASVFTIEGVFIEGPSGTARDYLEGDVIAPDGRFAVRGLQVGFHSIYLLYRDEVGTLRRTDSITPFLFAEDGSETWTLWWDGTDDNILIINEQSQEAAFLL